MNYSEIYANKKEIKIPTIFSAIFISLTIFFIAKFFFNTNNFSRASLKEISRIEITNVFPNQTTIFWQTDQKRAGWIVYGTKEDKLDNIVLDKKDNEKTKTAYINHYMVLQNLQENSQYFFKFVVDNHLIEKDNGQPFTFTTISNKIGINNLQPAYGKVINQKSRPLENAIVLLTIKGAYSLSALSKNSGEWLIPLNYIVDSKTQQLKTLSKTDEINIQIIDEEGHNSNITANLDSLSPLIETIMIGKDYDLLQKKDVLSAVSNSFEASSIDIIFPKENATIPAGNPLIKGKAIPNNTLIVTVNDSKSTTSIQTKADSNGTWQITLPQRLSPGSHKLVLQTKNTNGKTLSKARNFTIAKSGEQVLGEATNSATPTITNIPTATVQPTFLPTVKPTAPVSGGNITYIGLSSAALVLLGLGLLVSF